MYKGMRNVSRIKTVLLLFIRTLMASLICVLLWLFSGRVFNFLPAILFVITVIIYYPTALLVYFVIASDDVISTIIGIFISLAFLGLYIINIWGDLSLFTRIIFILGAIIGIAQTLKSVGLRFSGQNS